MDSVSLRTTSNEARSDPVSPEPSDFRHRARSLREYSSSIAARTILSHQSHSNRPHSTRLKYHCRKSSIRHKSFWSYAYGPAWARHRRHLCPRNYWQLDCTPDQFPARRVKQHNITYRITRRLDHQQLFLALLGLSRVNLVSAGQSCSYNIEGKEETRQ